MELQRIADQERTRVEPLRRRRELLVGLRQHLADLYAPPSLGDKHAKDRIAAESLMFLLDRNSNLSNGAVRGLVSAAAEFLLTRHELAQAWVREHEHDDRIDAKNLELAGYGVVCQFLQARTPSPSSSLRSRVLAHFWTELGKLGARGPRTMAEVRAIAQQAVTHHLPPEQPAEAPRLSPSASLHGGGDGSSRMPGQAAPVEAPDSPSMRRLPRQPVTREQDPLQFEKASADGVSAPSADG
ncbi:hypothetical protein [Ramlibacter aurantiacus]|uniref:hypothetical protein n=1 Tax=Ramlibacter aurantiacus TaxID=2801330 RepID=UPI001F4719A9|nr:hypothetical protein [Ramlibacter aurantiacus]